MCKKGFPPLRSPSDQKLVCDQRVFLFDLRYQWVTCNAILHIQLKSCLCKENYRDKYCIIWTILFWNKTVHTGSYISCQSVVCIDFKVFYENGCVHICVCIYTCTFM